MSIVLVLPPCSQCATEFGQQSQQLFSVEVRGGETYQLTCLNGHESLVLLQHRNFEVLFEIGLLALLDGYYREAVLDFAAATERFLEFFAYFVLFKHGVSESELSVCWKMLARQSERQLGTFLALYALNYNAAPRYLSNASIEFRNRVAHRGHIPDRSEAIRYGDDVLDFIRPILNDMKEHGGSVLGKLLTFDRMRPKNKTIYEMGAVFETALAIAYAPRTIDNYSLVQLLDYYPRFLRLKAERNLMGFTLSSVLQQT